MNNCNQNLVISLTELSESLIKTICVLRKNLEEKTADSSTVPVERTEPVFPESEEKKHLDMFPFLSLKNILGKFNSAELNQKILNDILIQLWVMFKSARWLKCVRFADLEGLYQRVLTFPDIDYDRFFYLKSSGTNVNDPANPLEYSLNIAIVASAIAKRIGYNEGKILIIRLASLLKNLGTTTIEEDVLRKPGKLTDEEFSLITMVPVHSFRLLNGVPETEQGPWPEIKEIIGYTHEKEDGSGYPQGLSKENIPEEAKIIGLAEVFEALTNGRKYRPPFLPYRAIKIISQERKDKFPHHLIKALFDVCSLYPVGTVFQLNTGQYGVVIKNTPNIARPVVETVNRKTKEIEIVSLAENHLLSIENVIEDFEKIQDILNTFGFGLEKKRDN